jgi:hypothetical protein
MGEDNMSSLVKAVFRFVGFCCIVLAFIGLFAVAASFVFILSWEREIEKPYFTLAGVSMSLVCMGCHFVLLYVGVQLARLKGHVYPLFVRLLIFEIIYIFLGPTLPAIFGAEVLGSFMTAASVANGGLIPQFITLFFLWGPFLIRRANRELELQEHAAASIAGSNLDNRQNGGGTA